MARRPREAESELASEVHFDLRLLKRTFRHDCMS